MKLTRKQKAIGVSLLFHAVLLTLLLFWYVPRRDAAAVSADARAEPESDRATRRDWPPADGPKTRLVEQQSDVSSSEIQDSIESQIEQAKKLPDEKKLTELEKNLKRLESVAGEQSVEQVSSTIADSLGLDVDQYAQKNVVADGVFDAGSAQMSDVLRTKGEDGSWQYETLMVDAGGHEMRVPLDPTEGQRLYDTFELMKRYPMAKGVYQSVVMPMMQKMLEAESVGRSNEPTVIVPPTEGDDL